jgi:hypothetical protein
VDPVTTKEAMMTENGRNNPNMQDGGNAIRYMACLLSQKGGMLCVRSEDAFVITCVANLMEVKVLYVQQDLQYEISSYCRFNV